MLMLCAEQVTALEAIKRRRDIAALAHALAAAFPAVPGRLGERYALLVDHGVQHAARHGLAHLACLARYLACWFMLGAEFETKPGFEWAAQLLRAAQRGQGAKAFQLSRRTREELARRASQPTPAVFDAALSSLDATMQPLGTLASLLPPQPVALGAACDLDAVDLRVTEAARPVYRFEQGEWRRVPPAAATASAVTLTHADGGALPPQLHLLAAGTGRGSARLRLRTRAAACCDAQWHPLVQHNSHLGIAAWRGPQAADVALDLPAARVDEAAPGTLQPVIAAESAAQLSVLTLAACGLRDSGQPLGELATRLAVYPGEQQLITWRREARGPHQVRAERDGLPLDATRWQAGLDELDRQLAEGLGRLATAWERESGVTHAQMQADPRVMCGSAGITWGWVAAPQGLEQPPCLRVAGMLDLLACQLNLRLAGELRLYGSHSRLALHCDAAQPLQQSFERGPGAALALPQCTAHQPFTLTLQALAQDEAAVLDVAGPLTGGVQLACGLRQRPQGFGLQWFATIAVLPLAVPLRLHDPLLGSRSVQHKLLPALTLLDWSLG